MKKLIWKRLWARKYAPFLPSIFLFSYLKNKQFGSAPNKMFVPEGKLTASYWEESEFTKLSKNYEKFLLRQRMKKYADVYEKKFQDFLSYSKYLSKLNISAYSLNKLKSLLGDFVEKQIELSDFQYYAFLILEGPALRLEKYFLKIKHGARILQWITTPYKLTEISKSHKELLQIVKNRKHLKLQNFALKYAWVPVYEPLDNPWTYDDFLNQAKNIRNPRRELGALNLRKKALKDFQKYYWSIKDIKLKKTVEIVHIFSYLKEMRDDYRRQAYYLLRPFLTQIAMKLKISFEELNYLAANELIESIKKNKSIVSKSEFLRRKKSYALILKNNKVRVLSGKKAIELGRKMQKTSEKQIIGFIANRGFVKGTVRIIYHQGEFQKFKDGEILVTTMTHPEFLQIMKKAKAIVTDEGGITCHAAIVSRELSIPCIIGTKNATRILKDGDLVEVDAERGVVRLLKKAK
jgi:phosphohistidine swiveling domain-containing protein